MTIARGPSPVSFACARRSPTGGSSWVRSQHCTDVIVVNEGEDSEAGCRASTISSHLEPRSSNQRAISTFKATVVTVDTNAKEAPMRAIMRHCGVGPNWASALAVGTHLSVSRKGLARPLWLGLALAAALPAVAIVMWAPRAGADPVVQPMRPSVAQNNTQTRTVAIQTATPSAAEFAQGLEGVTNQFAVEHGQRTKLVRVHCVQAAPGKYMCSYAVARAQGREECHLMQATWTPNSASTITVTLAGRTDRCRTLHEAIASLR